MKKIYDTLFQDSSGDSHFFYTGRKNILGLNYYDSFFDWGVSRPHDPNYPSYNFAYDRDSHAMIGYLEIEPTSEDEMVYINETIEVAICMQELRDGYYNNNYSKECLRILASQNSGYLHLEAELRSGSIVPNSCSFTFIPLNECNSIKNKIDIPFTLTTAKVKNNDGDIKTHLRIWIDNIENPLYIYGQYWQVLRRVYLKRSTSNSISSLPTNAINGQSLYNLYLSSDAIVDKKYYSNKYNVEFRDDSWGSRWQDDPSDTIITNSVNVNENIIVRLENLENSSMPTTKSCIINFDAIQAYNERKLMSISNVDITDSEEEFLTISQSNHISPITSGKYTLQLFHSSDKSEGLRENISVCRSGPGYSVPIYIRYFEIDNSSSKFERLSIPVTLALSQDDEIYIEYNVEKENSEDSYENTTYLSITKIS